MKNVKKLKTLTLIGSIALVFTFSKAQGSGEGLPCPLHPGIPNPDETAACIGNFSKALSLMNTDLVLYYHSIPSELDKFYSQKEASGDYAGKHWRFINDASLFLNPDQSLLTVVLGDGTSVFYQKDASSFYWPVDRRTSKSYIQFNERNQAVRKMMDGTEQVFGYQDSLGVYHLTTVVDSARKEILQLSRQGLGQIQSVSGVGLRGANIQSSLDSAMITNALGQQIRLQFAGGLLQSAHFPTPAGSVELMESFFYDENGNMVTHTDMMGRVTQMTYYPNGALRRVIDSLNYATNFKYTNDSVSVKTVSGTQVETFRNGKIESILNRESGALVSFVRDEQGRVIEQNTHGLKTLFSYGTSFLPIRIQTPDGLTISREYTTAPENGHQWSLVKSEQVTGPGGSFQTAFTYDALFRLIQKREGSAVFNYSYFGSTLLPTQVKLNNVALFTAQYDANGNQVGRTNFDGVATQFSVNEAGLPVSISSPYGESRITYDELNRPTRISSREGTRSLSYGPIGNVEQDAFMNPAGKGTMTQKTLKFMP